MKEGSAFEYTICGESQGGEVPREMKLVTLPESDWLEFKTRGPLPRSLQELTTYVFNNWKKKHPEHRCGEIDLEWHSAGDQDAADYECGLFLPVESVQPHDAPRSLCMTNATDNSCAGRNATNFLPTGNVRRQNASSGEENRPSRT